MNSLIYAGTVVRFYTSTPFTSVAGTVTDPTEVLFAYRVGNGPATQFTYSSGGSVGSIIKDSTLFKCQCISWYLKIFCHSIQRSRNVSHGLHAFYK